MPESPIALNLAVKEARIPESDTPQPTLVVTCAVHNTGSDAVSIVGDTLMFELFSRAGEPIEELPIANLVADGDSAGCRVEPGESAEISTSLKFEPEAVDASQKFCLKVNGFGVEARTDFNFEPS